VKLLRWEKDGGPESRVAGLFVIEIKSLFSVVLLRFSDGSRDAYHSHAFDAISWVLCGRLAEAVWQELGWWVYSPSWRPIVTRRSRFHRVTSVGTTWVLSFRGPWADTWLEETRARGVYRLTHGRREVA